VAAVVVAAFYGDAAGDAACCALETEKVNESARQKNKILEIEVWLPTFFILKMIID
jgi:hypothetical protein